MDSRFRESRDALGRMDCLGGPARLAAIAGLPVVDLDTGQQILLGELGS